MPAGLMGRGKLRWTVVAGAATASAVLTGALLVGDSMRGSLRRLALERLGSVDEALESPRFFRDSLSDEMATAAPHGAQPVLAPAIVLRGAAAHPVSGRRAAAVTVYAGAPSLWTLLGAAEPLAVTQGIGSVLPPVVLGDALRRELGTEVGETIVLRFGRPADAPRGTLLGDRNTEDLTGAIRVEVAGVLSDRGPGSFSAQPHQRVARNVFIDLSRVQRLLDRPEQANAIFVSRGGAPRGWTQERLDAALRAEDVGLTLTGAADHLQVGSRELIIDPALDEAAGRAAAKLGLPLMRVQSHLANALRHGERLVPYSLVAAVDAPGTPWGRLVLADGSPAPQLGPRELLINTWVAEDLAVGRGDEVDLDYYVVGAREELLERTVRFRIAGVVRMEGLAADRTLTPEHPGLRDARDIADWDPPFPVDLRRIRPRDEAWWDDHGLTPKAFVAEATGRELWATRFGSTTALRLGAVGGQDSGALERSWRAALARELVPASVGLSFAPIKERALRAASGATDFAALFLGFSSFLIISAALLAGLLFRLGVEQRVREVGLLLAVGYPVAKVRARLLREGLVLAGLGAILGVAFGIAYAALLVAALRTIWLPAVGSSALELHLGVKSLLLGPLAAVIVVGLAILFALRSIVRLPPPMLLAGITFRAARPGRGRTAAVAALVTFLTAVALAFNSGGDHPSAATAFGSGTALLVSGLLAFGAWCHGGRARGGGAGALVGMGARNARWRPGRSVLGTALVAMATFAVVVVAASRRDAGRGIEARASGSGGFSVVAEIEIPLLLNPGEATARDELGFDPRDSAALEGAEVFALRLRQGDDASCLNLYRPDRPRLLGAPRAFIERGGFAFAAVDSPEEAGGNPWTLLHGPREPGVVPAIGDEASVRWILHSGLGQELLIEDDLGRPLRLRIVALLQGSVLQSELIIAEEAFLEYFPGQSGFGFLLVDAPATQADAIVPAIERGLEPFGADATLVVERLRAYRAVENTYLTTFQTLGGLGLLLGTVGLGIVMARNVLERRAELAALRAFGFRRRTLTALVVAECVFLLFIGLVIGAAAAALTAAARESALDAPWLGLAATLAAVWIAGLLSSLLAARLALGAPLIPSLREER